MKKAFEITNKEMMSEVLDSVEFGTLALSVDNKPYSLPINFVEQDGDIFFHGSKKGKKISMMEKNPFCSFSAVEPISFLPSYFSNDKGDASPATHLYKSIIIDGQIEFVECYDEKLRALTSLMKKYQKEGGYESLNNDMYTKIVNATCIYKLVKKEISAKFYLGQHFNEKRYKRVCEHLEERGTKKDLQTLELIKQFHN